VIPFRAAAGRDAYAAAYRTKGHQMAATLKSLAEGSQGLKVAYKDDPAAVTVWSCPLSAKIERQLNALASSENVSASESIIPLFLALITRWDLKAERGGEVVPLTDEGIESVPYGFLMAIIDAVMADQAPKPPTEEPSSGV
jgi:hypothetical protein